VERRGQQGQDQEERLRPGSGDKILVQLGSTAAGEEEGAVLLRRFFFFFVGNTGV
jgi:hypothetical protein